MSFLDSVEVDGEGVGATYSFKLPWGFFIHLKSPTVELGSTCCGESLTAGNRPALTCLDCEAESAWPVTEGHWAFIEVMDSVLLEQWLRPFLAPLEAQVTAVELADELTAFYEEAYGVKLELQPGILSGNMLVPPDVAATLPGFV